MEQELDIILPNTTDLEVFSSDGSDISSSDIESALAKINQGKETLSKIKALFSGNEAKKELKAACGRKPLLDKKKKAAWEKCAADYMIRKATQVAQTSAPPSYSPSPSSSSNSGGGSGGSGGGQEKKILGMNPITFGIVAVVVLGVGAYFIMRKR